MRRVSVVLPAGLATGLAMAAFGYYVMLPAVLKAIGS